MKNNILLIVGPSGVGKTTLQNHLTQNYSFIIPICATTRSRRQDDNFSNYVYLCNEEFDNYSNNGAFFFQTGRGTKYGYFKLDENMDRPIILITSYKYVDFIKTISKNVAVFLLTYTNYMDSMYMRLSKRNISQDEILLRYIHAVEEYKMYYPIIKDDAQLIVHTDEYTEAETFLKAKEWIENNNFAQEISQNKIMRKRQL